MLGLALRNTNTCAQYQPHNLGPCNKSLQCGGYKELPLGFLSITNDHKDPRFHIYISIARYI